MLDAVYAYACFFIPILVYRQFCLVFPTACWIVGLSEPGLLSKINLTF